MLRLLVKSELCNDTQECPMLAPLPGSLEQLSQAEELSCLG